MHSSNICLNNQILAINTQNHILEHYAVISSYTLSNLIADLLQFAGDAVGKVKAGLEKTWDGVKAGAEYLTLTALRYALQGISTAINQLLYALFTTIAAVSSNFQVTANDPLQVMINNQNVAATIVASDFVLNLQVGSTVLPLFDMLQYFNPQAEMLDINHTPVYFTTITVLYLLLTTAILLLSHEPDGVALGFIIADLLMVTLAQITNFMNFSAAEQVKVAQWLWTFHGYVVIDILIFLGLLWYRKTITTDIIADSAIGEFAVAGLTGSVFSLIEALAHKNGYADILLPLYAETAPIVYLLPLEVAIVESKLVESEQPKSGRGITKATALIGVMVFLLVYHLYMAVYWRTMW